MCHQHCLSVNIIIFAFLVPHSDKCTLSKKHPPWCYVNVWLFFILCLLLGLSHDNNNITIVLYSIWFIKQICIWYFVKRKWFFLFLYKGRQWVEYNKDFGWRETTTSWLQLHSKCYIVFVGCSFLPPMLPTQLIYDILFLHLRCNYRVYSRGERGAVWCDLS